MIGEMYEDIQSRKNAEQQSRRLSEAVEGEVSPLRMRKNNIQDYVHGESGGAGRSEGKEGTHPLEPQTSRADSVNVFLEMFQKPILL
jgi:hypothetical protein